MIHWIVIMTIGAVLSMVPTTASAHNISDLTIQTNPSPYKLDDADIYVPTLEELLGGNVNDMQAIGDGSGIQFEIIDYAKQFLGTRYRSGAKGPSAFDCSGFTSYVFRKFDLSLASSSRAQANQGERISLTEAKPGDLMFFSGRRNSKSVGHVGIVVDVDQTTGKVKFIHAATSKGVSIDTYPDGGYYSKRFMHIQRVLPS